MNNLALVNDVETTLAKIQLLVPSSFDNKFANHDEQTIKLVMQICLDGLTDEQINTGLLSVRDMGFCPDPALFRRWCLGLKGFDNKDAIADSYIGKSGALSNITRWIAGDKKTNISVAEKQAYDETYHLWLNATDKFGETTAQSAFKDHYEMIVNKLVEQGVACQTYTSPVAITQSEIKREHKPASPEFVKNLFDKHSNANTTSEQVYKSRQILNQVGMGANHGK